MNCRTTAFSCVFLCFQMINGVLYVLNVESSGILIWFLSISLEFVWQEDLLEHLPNVYLSLFVLWLQWYKIWQLIRSG